MKHTAGRGAQIFRVLPEECRDEGVALTMSEGIVKVNMSELML